MHLTKLVVNLDFQKTIENFCNCKFNFRNYGYNSRIFWIWVVVFSFNDSLKITYKHNIIMEFNKLVTKNDFRLNRFKPLFSFSWKIMMTALINTIFSSLYVLVIGKAFSTISLGILYTYHKSQTLQ